MNYSFSENIQRGIIFLLKHDKEFYSQIVPLIRESYFEFPSYQRIFRHIVSYYEKYKKIPTDDILLEDIKYNLPESHNISDYEDDLFQINQIDESTIENKEFILDLVESYARKMSMKDAIKQSIVLLQDDRIEEIQELVREALQVSRNVNTGQNYFRDLQERLERVKKEKETDRFKLFLPTLNTLMEGGMCRKEMMMVIGVAGAGKSLTLANQAIVSLLEDRKVLYVSLEMSEDRIASRIDSILTLLPQKTLSAPEGEFELLRRTKMFQTKFGKGELVIKEFPSSLCNVNNIRGLLSQLSIYDGFVPDVIIVDYLELMRPVRQIEVEYEAQERIAVELRGLASEMKCFLITATQANREGKKVKIVTDAELASSYGKIRPVDLALSINQTTEERDKELLRMFVVKNRNNRQDFIIPCSINYNNLRIEEIPKEEKVSV